MIKPKDFLNVIALFFTSIITALSWALGGWDLALKTLMLFIVADYITGVLSAIYHKKLNSNIGYRGIIKKIGILIIVAIAFKLDEFTGANVLRTFAIGFFVANEGLSILENWGKMGLALPDILKD